MDHPKTIASVTALSQNAFSYPAYLAAQAGYSMMANDANSILVDYPKVTAGGTATFEAMACLMPTGSYYNPRIL